MQEKNIPDINSAAIKNARIDKGIEINELANNLCLSVKHITQIEEGGDSAFFSKSHKVQVAKKVGALLGLTEAQIIENIENPQENVSDKLEQANKNQELFNSDYQSDPLAELEKLGNTDLDSTSSKKTIFQIAATIAFIVILVGWFVSSRYSTNPPVEVVAVSSDIKEFSKPEEKVETKESALVIEQNVCDLSPKDVPAFKVTKANSAGNFIYFVSKADQDVCIIDASNKKQLIKLSKLEKRNFVGVAPFTVLSPDFSKLEVYYQGWKVPVSSNTNTIRTEEQSIRSESFKDNSPSNAN